VCHPRFWCRLQEEASNAAKIDRPVIEKKHVDGSVNEKKQDVQANAPAKPEPAKKLSISQESTNNVSIVTYGLQKAREGNNSLINIGLSLKLQ